MRVYLPASSTTVRRLVEDGQVAAPLTGFAVTPGLRAHYAGGNGVADDTDLEELEYAALTEAARASLRLIDADPTAWRRRIVLAVDVASATVRDDLDRGVIQLAEPVAIAQIAAAHVDDADAEAVVAAAAEAIVRADLGDDDAQEAVDDAEGNELSWYATQELSALLELG